jgi:chemotaxis protein MotB
MIFGAKRHAMRSVSVWPGYVDALGALLMVVIFVLMIFAVVQFLLSEILSDQESELAVLQRHLSELTKSLGLEQQKSERLANEVTLLTGMVNNLTEKRQELSRQVADLTRQSAVDRARIEEQLRLTASLQEDIDALRRVREELEQRVGRLAAALESKETEVDTLRDRSKALEARLADEKERTTLAQEEIQQKDIRIQALSAVVGEQKQALEEERRLSADTRAEVALLNRQITNLRLQLEEINRALETAEGEKLAREAELKELGRRLNIVLARRVNKLEQYRSEFFGRLREILGDSPNVRIEGDRFVLQAELLFETGSAELGEQGKTHLSKLATTLRQLSSRIPEDLNWVLRIDGHTDRVPIHNETFASNWELSTARAVAVVRFLADRGIPEGRMAAAGFSKFHPIDPAHTPGAYRKNRRIEIKLTSR